jgi:hypothetical protein
VFGVHVFAVSDVCLALPCTGDLFTMQSPTLGLHHLHPALSVGLPDADSCIPPVNQGKSLNCSELKASALAPR